MDRKLDPPLYMGLTLKSLLEKSDVLNTVNAALKATKEDGEKKGEDPWDSVDGQSAFLGPSLWDRDMFFDGDLKTPESKISGEFSLFGHTNAGQTKQAGKHAMPYGMEYMDLDEFLTESGVPLAVNEIPHAVSPPSVELTPPRLIASPPSVSNDPILISTELPESAGSPEDAYDSQVESPISVSFSVEKETAVKKTSSKTSKKQLLRALECPSPMDSDLDLSMSSDGFDPRYRRYTDDDLKPQPMSKKSKKQVRANQQYVPDDLKDDRYWARRRKNNMAAKRSRDARRMKENQIAVRAVFLEKENASLKAEVERLRKENQQLKLNKKG